MGTTKRRTRRAWEKRKKPCPGECDFCDFPISYVSGYYCWQCRKWHCQDHRLPHDHRCRGWEEVYRLQKKGLRKTYLTHAFYRCWLETGSPTMAMEWTAKMARHSTKSMTVAHYLEDVPIIRAYASWEIWKIVSGEIQTTLK